MPRILLPTLALLAAGLSRPAAAEVVRLAVVLGNNEGDAQSVPLLFAEEDARRVGAVLTRLGGIKSDQQILLLGAGRNRLLRAMAEVREQVAAATARGDETVVVFFYSGHADNERLQLGRSWVTWAELRDLLARTGADVRVAFVDACQSGALTRLKGIKREPGFLLDLRERTEAKGQVVITSSSADEASQESEEIAGSYFTWALVNALTGSADDDTDGQVTLTEVWDYVQGETAFRTAHTRAGAQHPTYAWALTGTGDVVLSDLGASKATLAFPSGLSGRFAVFDLDRRAFVAEVSLQGEARPLSLPAGRYLVQQRHPTHLEVAELRLEAGATRALALDAFAAVQYEDDVAKGTVEQTVRRARRPEVHLTGQLLSRSYSDETVSQDYLPATGAAGLEARLVWRSGTYGSVDANWGRARAGVAVPGLPYAVDTVIDSSTIGLGLGRGTRPGRLWDLAAGARLAAVATQREFTDATLPTQGLFTVAPGVAGRVGLRPGPVRLAAELRLHYLPYRIDDIDRGVAFTEFTLSLGARL